MPHRFLSVALILTSLAAVGCIGDLFDRTPEKIAALRMSGNLVGAKEETLEALRRKPARMDLWRELASTDVLLSRRSAQIKEVPQDPLPELVEAALICAAYTDHHKGVLDREWEGVGVLAAIEVSNRANALVSKLDPALEDPAPVDVPMTTTPDVEEPADDNLVLPQRPELREAETYLDPQAVGRIIRRTVILTEFLRHLPADNPMVTAVSLNQLEERLRSVSMRANITRAFVEAQEDSARLEMSHVLGDADSSLAERGYFDPAVIFDQILLQ